VNHASAQKLLDLPGSLFRFTPQEGSLFRQSEVVLAAVLANSDASVSEE